MHDLLLGCVYTDLLWKQKAYLVQLSPMKLKRVFYVNQSFKRSIPQVNGETALTVSFICLNSTLCKGAVGYRRK